VAVAEGGRAVGVRPEELGVDPVGDDLDRRGDADVPQVSRAGLLGTTTASVRFMYQRSQRTAAPSITRERRPFAM
jgi:hypothetical protein